MSANNGNVFIQIKKPLGERQDNIVSQHKTLKQLKGDTKENFTNASAATHLEKNVPRLKHQPTINDFVPQAIDETTRRIDAETQSESNIIASDLTSSCDPGASYYKRLAEQRREALQQTLLENKHLNERIECLEEELDTSRKELDEAVQLTEILKEFLADGEEEVTDENSEGLEDDVADH